MAYIELTLLGYAAKVDHMNSLTMEKLSPSRLTIGYYMHEMHWRMNRDTGKGLSETPKSKDENTTSPREDSNKKSEMESAESKRQIPIQDVFAF